MEHLTYEQLDEEIRNQVDELFVSETEREKSDIKHAVINVVNLVDVDIDSLVKSLVLAMPTHPNCRCVVPRFLVERRMFRKYQVHPVPRRIKMSARWRRVFDPKLSVRANVSFFRVVQYDHCSGVTK